MVQGRRWLMVLLGVVLACGAIARVGEASDGWEQVTIASEGDNPFPRGSFATTTTGKQSKGWMFGGVFDQFQPFPNPTLFEFYDDLFRIKLLQGGSKVRFDRVTTTGPAPSKRAFPSLAAIKRGSGDKVYLFGGGEYDDFSLTPASDKFWVYDEATNAWTDLSGLGGPGPRAGAALVANGTDLYLFGGVAPDGFLLTTYNDLWRFNTKTGVWTLLSDASGPDPRHMAMATVIDNKLLVYGGERIEISFFPEFSIEFPIDQSTWTWDLKHGGWTRLADGPARNYSAFASKGDFAILFGGDAAGGVDCEAAPFAQNPTNDTFAFHPSCGWFQLDLDDPPPPSKRTSGFVIGGRFYTFGGFDFVCDCCGGFSGQVWNMSVHRVSVP